MSNRGYSVFTALLIASVAVPSITLAQSAEALIEEGLVLRRQSRDQEALDRFQRAYEMSRAPRALAQVALAEQALGNFVEAEVHLSQALAVQTDGWITSRRGALQQALATIEARLGTIELTGGAPGAEVWVNGELRGTLPQAARLRVRAGSAVVEIRANGYAPIQRPVSVSAGGVAREGLNMVTVQANAGGPIMQPNPNAGPINQQPINQQPINQPTYRTTEYDTHPNWALFGIGAALFGVPWIGTWVGTLASTTEGDLIGMSFAPVLGPFLLLINIDFGFDEEFYLQFLFVLDAIAQGAGIVLAIIGLASQQTDMVATLEGGPRPARLAVRPMRHPGAQGLELVLTHF